MSEAALRGGELGAGPPPLPPVHPHPFAQPAAQPAAQQLQGPPLPTAAWGVQAGGGAPPTAPVMLQQLAGGDGAPAAVTTPAVGGQPPIEHEGGAAVQQALAPPLAGMPGITVPVSTVPDLQQAALGGPPAEAGMPAAAAVAAAGGEPHHLPQGLHHLTRHWLPEEARGEAVLQRLGAPDIRTAEHLIRTMGQRELRDAFQRVYGAATQSFNNTWLRRKLAEALGVKASGASKSRKRAGGGRGAAKRPGASSRGSARPSSRGRAAGGGAAVAARPGSRATAKAALAVAMAEADDYLSEEEEEEEEDGGEFDEDAEFWSDRTPPSAGLRPDSAGRPGSSGGGSGGFSVPHAAAAAVAAAAAAASGGSGGDAEGVRRSSRQTARRDAQAAAVLQDFAGGLLSAAEQLRTPNPPILPPPPPLPTELQPGWGTQAPTAAEMQHWRHEWRQRHLPEAGSEERRHAASPRPGATSPGAQHAQQAQHAPMLQSVTHQFLQQCTVQLAAHQQQAALHPAQPHGPGQLPLFVGGGTISPRNPEPVPPAIAAAVAAAQAAAAAGAVPPPPVQQPALQMAAFEFAAPLPLSTMQQLPQAAAAMAHQAQQAAEAAAAAAARNALPPFTFAAPPQPAVVPAAAAPSPTCPGVAVPVTAVSSAPLPPPGQLPTELAAEPASPEGPGVAVPVASAAAGATAHGSPAGPGVAVPVAAVQDAPVPPLWQPMAAQLPPHAAPFGPLPPLAIEPPTLRQQPPPDPTTPHSGLKMPKPQVPAQPAQGQAPAGST